MRRREGHTGGRDGDDTDGEADEDGNGSKGSKGGQQGQFSNAVLDEFETSRIYHVIDNA